MIYNIKNHRFDSFLPLQCFVRSAALSTIFILTLLVTNRKVFPLYMFFRLVNFALGPFGPPCPVLGSEIKRPLLREYVMQLKSQIAEFSSILTSGPLKAPRLLSVRMQEMSEMTKQIPRAREEATGKRRNHQRRLCALPKLDRERAGGWRGDRRINI